VQDWNRRRLSGMGRQMRILILFVTLVAFAQSAYPAEKTFRSAINIKVGETKRLGIAGGHKPDCVTSISPEIEILREPTLGALSQRYNTPYVAENSLSGTCNGAHLFGTEVDYIANSAGADVVQFDAVFPNGRLHYNISVKVH
jgi:hypothetical protein